MTVLTGVDAGGTKTVAAVSDGTRELARATGPAGAVRPGRAMAAAGAIATTVRRALAAAGLLRTEVLLVGASGVGRLEERQALRDALRIEGFADHLVVTTDIEIALEAAFGAGPGIVLLAGTGSFGVARLPGGDLVRRGGYGWQMGDEGSAYDLGRRGLAAAGKARDGRGPATSLESALVAAARTGDFEGLVRWSVGAGPGEVAALAAVVVSEAAEGDSVAMAIIGESAQALADHATSLVKQYPDDHPVPVALAGGLLDQPLYRQAVEGCLTGQPRLALQAAPIDPVLGALALAAR